MYSTIYTNIYNNLRRTFACDLIGRLSFEGRQGLGGESDTDRVKSSKGREGRE